MSSLPPPPLMCVLSSDRNKLLANTAAFFFDWLTFFFSQQNVWGHLPLIIINTLTFTTLSGLPHILIHLSPVWIQTDLGGSQLTIKIKNGYGRETPCLVNGQCTFSSGQLNCQSFRAFKLCVIIGSQCKTFQHISSVEGK